MTSKFPKPMSQQALLLRDTQQFREVRASTEEASSSLEEQCPALWMFSAALTGLLTSDESEVYRRHLVCCDACRSLEQALGEELKAIERSIPQPSVSSLRLSFKKASLLSPLAEDFWSSVEGHFNLNADTHESSNNSLSTPTVGMVAPFAEECQDASQSLPVTEERWWSRWIRLLEISQAIPAMASGMAVVCIVVLLIPASPLFRSSVDTRNSLRGQRQTQGLSLGTRSKSGHLLSSTRPVLGRPGVRFYLRRAGQIFEGVDGLHARAGDQLRFGVWLNGVKRAFLTLFVVDQKGEFTLLYPSTEDSALSLTASSEARQMLPGGVVLSPSKFDERIVVCVSKERRSYVQMRRAFERSIEKVGFVRLGKMSLKGCLFQKSWLLRRKGER